MLPLSLVVCSQVFDTGTRTIETPNIFFNDSNLSFKLSLISWHYKIPFSRFQLVQSDWPSREAGLVPYRYGTTFEITTGIPPRKARSLYVPLTFHLRTMCICSQWKIDQERSWISDFVCFAVKYHRNWMFSLFLSLCLVKTQRGYWDPNMVPT